MNERRTKICEKAFEVIDKTGKGQITIKDIENVYSVAKNKDFIEGKKTKQEILNEFINNFEGAKGNKDGIITKEEYMDYYTDISMTIPNDDYFVGVIESVWMISENEGSASFQSELDKLVEAVRESLRKIAQPLDEMILTKFFKELNKSKSGAMTVDELQATLVRLCKSVERNQLIALFKRIDLNKSGCIEFDEFCNFILKK